MIDFSKVKSGDKVLVEMEVSLVNINTCELIYQRGRALGVMPILVEKASIKEHIPAPRPIEVGCTVKWRLSSEILGKVVAVCQDHAWVYCEKLQIPCTYALTDITRIP